MERMRFASRGRENIGSRPARRTHSPLFRQFLVGNGRVYCEPSKSGRLCPYTQSAEFAATQSRVLDMFTQTPRTTRLRPRLRHRRILPTFGPIRTASVSRTRPRPVKNRECIYKYVDRGDNVGKPDRGIQSIAIAGMWRQYSARQ